MSSSVIPKVGDPGIRGTKGDDGVDFAIANGFAGGYSLLDGPQPINPEDGYTTISFLPFVEYIASTTDKTFDFDPTLKTNIDDININEVVVVGILNLAFTADLNTYISFRILENDEEVYYTSQDQTINATPASTTSILQFEFILLLKKSKEYKFQIKTTSNITLSPSLPSRISLAIRD